MINSTLNGQAVEVCPNCSAKYDLTSGDPLEQIIADQFNPYARNFENIERELKELLLRDPTSEEVEACLV